MKDLSLHLMDIVQNSVAAGANHIRISLILQNEMLYLKVTDNGNGIEPELLKKVTDPFVTTRITRKVGLGISLLKFSAEMAGGSLEIQSEKGKGTELTARFKRDHIDRIPVGDIGDTMKALVPAYSGLDFELRFRADSKEYELKTQEIKNYLNGVPLKNTDILNWIGDSIQEGLNEVFGGVLDEISG